MTADRQIHHSEGYNWIKNSNKEYLMRDVIENGYISDTKGVFHLLSNVVSIKWLLFKGKVVIEPSDDLKEYFTDEEVAAMAEAK